ncbi:MAG: hypothetical protein K2N94_16055, partial [Lachnospiraceae bacterium]|nr:hypothetical protein [Lachnospiraceae bacterium]
RTGGPGKPGGDDPEAEGASGRRWRAGGQCRYDERQQLAQGRAYKTAFFVLLFYIMMATLLENLEITGMLMSFAGLWLGICIAVSVFAVICIWRDAYLSLYERAGTLLVVFGIIFILNLVISIQTILDGTPLIVDGRLGPKCLNLIVSAMLAVILIMFAAKLRYNKRLEEDEDE